MDREKLNRGGYWDCRGMPRPGRSPCYNLHSPEGFTVEAILMISSVGEVIVLKNALNQRNLSPRDPR
jgi:hypothetical protein